MGVVQSQVLSDDFGNVENGVDAQGQLFGAELFVAVEEEGVVGGQGGKELGDFGVVHVEDPVVGRVLGRDPHVNLVVGDPVAV